MGYIFVGLGNPGNEYIGTRHNIGRDSVIAFAKKFNFAEWKEDRKRNVLTSKGEIEGVAIELLLPNTYMNKSGGPLTGLVGSPKKIEKLIVIQDELDLPLGRIKLSFDRSAGGHKGIQSIIRTLKSQAFGRVRIGIAKPKKGGVKKPEHDETGDFVLGTFKPAEKEELTKVRKHVFEALVTIAREGFDAAMNQANSW